MTKAGRREKRAYTKRHWKIPVILMLVLLAGLLTALTQGNALPIRMRPGEASTQTPAAGSGDGSGDVIPEEPQIPERAGSGAADADEEPPADASPVEEMPEEPVSPIVTESAAVGDDYFADAIFVGDSRTEGFMLYSGLKNAQSLTTVGLTVREAFQKETVKVDGKKMTVMDALATKSFGKIYIMLGMNELGWVYAEQFQEEYGKIIDRVREINPQAEIYIQSILPVSQKKDDEGTYVNNQRINAYNELLIQLAEEKEVAYVNVAEAVSDETGKLPEDATADGVHLQPSSCKIWLEYLKTHTIEGMNG